MCHHFMYFSFASKDKGSCNVSTCKFIRFPLNSYTFHALIRFLRPNSPRNGRFSIFLYLFFTFTAYYYIGYPCLVLYAVWVFRSIKRTSHYKFSCGNCGAKMKLKGTCPHCGAINE
jgi:hypothetical protein